MYSILREGLLYSQGQLLFPVMIYLPIPGIDLNLFHAGRRIFGSEYLKFSNKYLLTSVCRALVTVCQRHTVQPKRVMLPQKISKNILYIYIK